MQILERWRGRAARAELRRLQGSRPNFNVYFSASQVAAHLWDYGEDDLAVRAITMSAHELAQIQAIASWYEDPDHPLPAEGRITHRHVDALAAITFYEGEVRPLDRARRRPERNRSAAYTPAPPSPSSGLPTDPV